MSAPGQSRDLTKTMIRGSLWLFSASFLLTVASFVANWALGWWLSKEDFGIYALAVSCSTLLQVFRDGGVQYWLARQDETRYRENQAAAFWLTVTASLVVALTLVVISPLIGRLYHSEDVARLVLLLGLATPLLSLSIVSDAGLQVSMRFRELSFIRGLTGVLRHVLTVLLAYFGFGPYSFVYPIFAVAIVQATVSFWLTGTRPWQFRLAWRDAVSVASACKWAMTGTFATAVLQQIDYVILGLIAAADNSGKVVVGTYFFAFMFAMQPATLLGQSVRKVFVPAFAATGSDARRRERGATKATSVLGLVVSPLVLLFALSSGEIEQFLWHGKWQSAVPAIQLLAMVVPIHLLVDVSRMIIQADGRFRLWTTTVFLRGASLAAAVLLAGALGGGQNATIVAACVAAFIAVGGLAESTLLFHKASLPLSLVWRSFLTPYFASLLGAAVAWRLSPTDTPSLVHLVMTLGTFLVLVGGVMILFFRRQLLQLVALGRRTSVVASVQPMTAADVGFEMKVHDSSSQSLS